MNKLTPTQAEQIQEIGRYLKQKRLELSLPLEQVFVSTHIRPYLLTALEDGKIEQLPELIYIQGFIRRYAAFLQIDDQFLMEKLVIDEPEQDSVTTEDPNLERITITQAENISKNQFKFNLLHLTLLAASILVASYLLLRPNQSQLASQESANLSLSATKPKSEVKPAIKPDSVKVAVSASSSTKPKSEVKPAIKPDSGKVAISTPSPTKPKSEVKPAIKPDSGKVAVSAPSPTKPKSEVKPAIKPDSGKVVVSAPSPTKPKSDAKATNNKQVSVKVSLEGASWLRVKIDDKTVFEGVMEKGMTQTWTGSQKISLRAGNSGAVNLSVNQQPTQRLGELGQVKDINITKGMGNGNQGE